MSANMLPSKEERFYGRVELTRANQGGLGEYEVDRENIRGAKVGLNSDSRGGDQII